MARTEPELKVTDWLGEMAMFLLKEMVALSLMKSMSEKRSWLLSGFRASFSSDEIILREFDSTIKLSESRVVKVKGVAGSEELEIEREAPLLRLRFAPFSILRLDPLFTFKAAPSAKFSEDPSARFN